MNSKPTNPRDVILPGALRASAGPLRNLKTVTEPSRFLKVIAVIEPTTQYSASVMLGVTIENVVVPPPVGAQIVFVRDDMRGVQFSGIVVDDNPKRIVIRHASRL